MTPQELLVEPVNRALNGIIAMDPDASTKLERVSGRRVRVHLTAPEVVLELAFTTAGVTVSSGGTEEVAPDLTISGRLDDMIGLLRDSGGGSSGLRFDGDPTVAQRLQGFFRELDVDWEEGLAHYLGDIPAHQVGRTLRGLGEWLRHGAASARDSLVEYLTEEQGALPTRAELEDFLADVDRLREDTDRLAARLSLLEQRRSRDG